MNQNYKTTKKGCLLLLGWSIFLIAIVFCRIFVQMNIQLTKLLPGCFLLKYTGFYCPGCGGTRAMVALFHGQLLQSFIYNPILVYSMAVYIGFLVSHSISYLTKQKVPIAIKYRPFYVYLGIGLLLLNWIIKNIAMFCAT